MHLVRALAWERPPSFSALRKTRPVHILPEGTGIPGTSLPSRGYVVTLVLTPQRKEIRLHLPWRRRQPGIGDSRNDVWHLPCVQGTDFSERFAGLQACSSA